MNKVLNFGEAIEVVKLGGLATRKGWNGKGMFIFQRPSDELPTEFVINKVKSLPQSLKDYYKDCDNLGDTILFTPYLCMKAADGTIVNGWLASQTDVLSDDWIIVG